MSSDSKHRGPERQRSPLLPAGALRRWRSQVARIFFAGCDRRRDPRLRPGLRELAVVQADQERERHRRSRSGRKRVPADQCKPRCRSQPVRDRHGQRTDLPHGCRTTPETASREAAGQSRRVRLRSERNGEGAPAMVRPPDLCASLLACSRCREPRSRGSRATSSAAGSPPSVSKTTV
jgi:hypothetical protein